MIISRATLRSGLGSRRSSCDVVRGRFFSASTVPTSSLSTHLHPLFLFRHMPGPLSNEEIQRFNCDGYIIKRSFYSREEMDLLYRIAKSDRQLGEHAIDVPDVSGRVSKLTVWNYLSESNNDIYSLIGRGKRMVEAWEQLLGDTVYHYHSKCMLKEPKSGGAWEWHTDHGYWHKNGCLTARMGSGLIAIDRATKANGCLQVLAGSHHLARIEHGTVGGQTGADLDAVEAAAKMCDLVHIECEPGDTLLFHSSLLHCSAPNTSDHSRWSLICCYNAKSNDPIRKSHHPNYHKLIKVEDSAILEYKARLERGEVQHDIVNAERHRSFLNPDDDESTPGSKKGSLSV